MSTSYMSYSGYVCSLLRQVSIRAIPQAMAKPSMIVRIASKLPTLRSSQDIPSMSPKFSSAHPNADRGKLFLSTILLMQMKLPKHTYCQISAPLCLCGGMFRCIVNNILSFVSAVLASDVFHGPTSPSNICFCYLVVPISPVFLSI